ncbi:MAG: FAD-dependent oxidoreductase [Kineosporiaceae bacterium]
MSASSPVDLLVVGAGPVGLAAAIRAASAGMRVTVLDPRDPGDGIDKACGEGLMPGAAATLASLGVRPQGRPFRGIAYQDAHGTTRAQALFRGEAGLGVRRTTLSRALAARASEVGVGWEPLAVADVTQDDARVTVTTRGGHTLGRAGSSRPTACTARSAACSRARPPPGRRRYPRYGLRRHYRTAPWSDLVEVTWARDAEAYVTPVAPDLVGVAVLCGGGEGFDGWLARFPRLAQRLEGAQADGPVRGCGPLRQASRRRRHGRVLLAGDAAGYVDALTGEGLAVGLRSAVTAVDCLVAGRPEDYPRRWAALSARPRVLTGGLLAASRVAPVRGRIVPAAAALPGVFGWVVAQLA